MNAKQRPVAALIPQFTAHIQYEVLFPRGSFYANLHNKNNVVERRIGSIRHIRLDGPR